MLLQKVDQLGEQSRLWFFDNITRQSEWLTVNPNAITQLRLDYLYRMTWRLDVDDNHFILTENSTTLTDVMLMLNIETELQPDYIVEVIDNKTVLIK